MAIRRNSDSVEKMKFGRDYFTSYQPIRIRSMISAQKLGATGRKRKQQVLWAITIEVCRETARNKLNEDDYLHTELNLLPRKMPGRRGVRLSCLSREYWLPLPIDEGRPDALILQVAEFGLLNLLQALPESSMTLLRLTPIQNMDMTWKIEI